MSAATAPALPPLTQAEAEHLCAEVRAAHARRPLAGWLTAARWQCWGCLRFSREPAKRCMGSQPGWRGCILINRLTENRPENRPEREP